VWIFGDPDDTEEMVVIGRVRPPHVSHFDSVISKWGMTPKCRLRRVSKRLAAGTGWPIGTSGLRRLPIHAPYPARRAATTWLGAGLTMGCPSTTTVGTVSLPSATDRTTAAASGSAQMLTWWTERRCHRKIRRSRRQNTQPGRQYNVILGSARGGSAGPFTGTSQPRTAALPESDQAELPVDGH